MSDMRDFTPQKNIDHEIRTESAFIDTGAPEVMVKESYTLDDSGGLGEFHRPIIEEESSNRGPILGALAVALMVGAAGAVAYSMYGTGSEVVADESLPQTKAPQTAAVVEKAPPPPVTDTAMTPPADTAMRTPPAPPVTTPEPRTSQQRLAATPRVTTPPVAPTMTPAPAPVTAAPAPVTAAPAPATIAPAVTPPPAQASAVPEPVSPTPPASAVAGTPSNLQSAAPEPEPVTPAAPAEAAPAPEAAPAQPAAPVDQSQ
jgi:hypothetical protein